MTGSAFSMGIVIADRAFRITAAELRPVERTTDSGRVTIRWLCPDCGSWISGTGGTSGYLIKVTRRVISAAGRASREARPRS
jgi:hypothetical protein